MSKVNDGGQVYPVVAPIYGSNERPKKRLIEGMSLRDHFANQATEEDVLFWQLCKPEEQTSREEAKYRYADEMLKVREK